MLTKVASAENTKVEKCVNRGFLQGCTPQPRPRELQEWRYSVVDVVSDDYDRNFDGNSPRAGVLVRSKVVVTIPRLPLYIGRGKVRR